MLSPRFGISCEIASRKFGISCNSWSAQHDAKRIIARRTSNLLRQLALETRPILSFLGDREKREQEVRSLNGIGDSFKKIIVTRDDVRLSRDENGIVTMCLRDFLLDPDSLDA